MYTLIIDSATKVLYHALVKDNEVVFESYTKGQNDFAKNIVKIIEDIYKKFNIKTSDLDKVICGVGPGSYTGVRMAVTVSKMISVFKNVPLYEISTLFLMSSGYKNKVLATIDARRGNSFSAIYDNYELSLSEAIRHTEELLKNEFDTRVTEESYKVDPIVVIKYAKEVKNPHGLNPNYLQETEAERNLHNEA